MLAVVIPTHEVVGMSPMREFLGLVSGAGCWLGSRARGVMDSPSETSPRNQPKNPLVL